jgi:hypothetical protein
MHDEPPGDYNRTGSSLLFTQSVNFRKKKMRTLYLIALIIGLASCSKQRTEDSTVDCSGPAKSYLSDVSTVLQTSCNDDSGCHGAGSNNGPGPLLTYEQVFNAKSAIRAAVVTGAMPLNGKLTAAQKNAILCWIENGAPNN